MSEYTFRGGYIEDASGDRWWSADLLARVERERDRAQAQLENVLDASKEGAWMARALDAERERDELKAEVERERRANADFEWQVERIEDGVRGVGMFLRRTDGGDSKAPSGEARNLYLNYGDAAKERDIAIRERDELKTRLAHADSVRSQLAELHAVACRVSREMEYHAASISNEGNQALRRLADVLAGAAGSADGVAAQDVERLRRLSDSKNAQRIAAEHRAMVAERERDELKTRLAHAEADAEQAIHNEAFNERQRILTYIRVRLAHATLDDRVSFRERGVMIDLANSIERGEHER